MVPWQGGLWAIQCGNSKGAGRDYNAGRRMGEGNVL